MGFVDITNLYWYYGGAGRKDRRPGVNIITHAAVPIRKDTGGCAVLWGAKHE